MSDFDINQLIEILPKLIRENDQVKGAIISALSGVVATHEDVVQIIAEMDRRFEEMQRQSDKRFDAVDKRFEEMQRQSDKRFDAMDKRFEEMQRQSDKRFEAMDKRFDAMDKRFEGVDRRLDSLEYAVKDLAISIHRMESKGGKTLEKMVLDLMAETLRLEKVDPATIRTEYLTDPEGAVFYEGYSTDIDVIVENGNLYLIEIKANADTNDVAHYLQNIKLYQKGTQKAVTKPIMVCLRIKESAKLLAESRGIRVIAGSIIE